MTLQWTVVAGVLYIEIAITAILLFPWLSPSFWRRVLKSRVLSAICAFSQVYSIAAALILFLLFADAIREVGKYSLVGSSSDTRKYAADTDALIHMRLFRSQRNLYISGFSLLLFLVIRRISGLLSRSAQMEIAAEAALKQAESANKMAAALLDASDESEKLKELQRQNEELGAELKKAQVDKETLLKQAENLQVEYNRISDLLNDQQLPDIGAVGDNKKDN